MTAQESPWLAHLRKMWHREQGPQEPEATGITGEPTVEQLAQWASVMLGGRLASIASLLNAAAAPGTPPASDDDLREMEARKDAAYLERNRVVAALAKCFPSGVARTAIDGWSEDWHGCVYIDLPTGQVSWHFHDSQAYLFAGLPTYTKPWDGHDTDEKYRRVDALSPPASGRPAKLPSGVGLADAIRAMEPERPGTFSYESWDNYKTGFEDAQSSAAALAGAVGAGGNCPDCKRPKAHNAIDAMAGKCPKWWAIYDSAADADCKRVAASAPGDPESRVVAKQTEYGTVYMMRDPSCPVQAKMPSAPGGDPSRLNPD